MSWITRLLGIDKLSARITKNEQVQSDIAQHLGMMIHTDWLGKTWGASPRPRLPISLQDESLDGQSVLVFATDDNTPLPLCDDIDRLRLSVVRLQKQLDLSTRYHFANLKDYSDPPMNAIIEAILKHLELSVYRYPPRGEVWEVRKKEQKDGK